MINGFHVSAKVAFPVFLVSIFSGCSALQSPFDNKASYRRGEKPSYTVAQLTNRDDADCEANDSGCVAIGKVVLTKPSENLSFQIFLRSRDHSGNLNENVVTCVSPAEAGKTVSTNASASTVIPIKISGAASSASGTVDSAATENLVVLKSIDPATQYVATAMFANCLAYAGGMYEAAEAAKIQEKIIDNAVAIAAGASQASK